MRSRTQGRGVAFLIAVGLVVVTGCGGDAEQERVDLLASDPGASLAGVCDVFLAQVGEKTPWTVKGTPETKVAPATEADVGAADLEEGSHLGLLKVTLADADGKETPFRFVFLSVPIYGTWMLKKIGTIDDAGQVQTFAGDVDAFYEINSVQSRHPGA